MDTLDKFFRGLGIGVIVLLMVCVLAIVAAFPTMWTWNFVMPYLFHLRTIGLLQAFCLNWLSLTFFHSNISTSK